jgi:integrase
LHLLPELIRLHDLRHTHATLALTAGVATRSERLGHSTLAVTADIYQHVSTSLEERAAAKVAAPVFQHAAKPEGQSGTT